MSTVQSIYDVLQYRPDIQPNNDDLIHIVNSAIRSISKRLYVLDSDLITAQMSVDVFSEQTYTASMAFTASSTGVAGTITDAASQFVVEGFAAGMPITTTHTTNPGPFRIATVAAGTLTMHTDDTVSAAIASSITITSDDSYGFLPSDFWGLRERFEPYLEDRTTPLSPLKNQSTVLQYNGSGTPEYYKIQGSKIYVTPHTGDDHTIVADYYQRPAAVTGPTSAVPFNERFDDLIADYVEIYFRGPLGKSGNTVQILDKLIRDGVDLVSLKHDRKGPAECARAVNWDL